MQNKKQKKHAEQNNTRSKKKSFRVSISTGVFINTIRSKEIYS